MTLFHHDSRDYNEAASEAATRAREKLERTIEEGRARAAEVLEQVQNQIPEDKIIDGKILQFVPVASGVEVSVALRDENQAIHDHAMQQIAERANMPIRYVRHLQGQEWGPELLAHNLNQLYRHSDKRYLARTVTNGKKEIRGFLSDSYRRLDSRPILDAFCQAAQQLGAVPVTGYALDTKVALKALLPMVFEPVPNEIVAFGLAWENSDFGNGALSLRGFMMRLWCTNFAIAETSMRQVHIGKRIDADFTFSQKTYELDTQAAASATQDLVAGYLTPAKIEEQCALIKRAHEENVEPTQVAKFLKKHLNKGEIQSVTESFNSADVVNLPAGNTKWRLSNAISWVAGNMKNRERGLDLMKVAHKAVGE